MEVEYKNILIGIVIGLLVGAGAGYTYGQTLIAEYKEDIDRIEAENLGIRESYDNLHSDHVKLTSEYSNLTAEKDTLANILSLLEIKYESLQNSHSSLESSFNELESSLEKLENDYRGLLTTLSILDAKGYSITEEFELFAGQTLRYEYDVGYGIIWIVEISHIHKPGSRFMCYVNWRQGEQGGCVSGGCNTLEQGFPSVTGTVSTNIYDEGDVLFIRSNINVPDVPSFCRDGSGRLLKKTFEETKIVVNGGFEEPAFNVVGWETGGHIGCGSGEDSLEGRQLGLAQDLGAMASQKVYLYESDLYLEFYYRPVPKDIPIEFIVYFDDNIILSETFTGSVLPWTSMKISLDPLLETYGEHTLKFVVPKNPDCTDESSRVMIDKVSIS